MYGIVSARTISVLALVAVCLVLMATGGYSLYQSVFDCKQETPVRILDEMSAV